MRGDEKEGQSGKNDEMDIERAAVGEMRPSHRAIPVQSNGHTHTHTHWMLSLSNGPLFFHSHTHTHTVYEGGGRRFEVSLQLRGLTPQVSP